MSFILNSFKLGRGKKREDVVDMAMHTYTSIDDSLETMLISGYFDLAETTYGSKIIRLGDMIIIKGALYDSGIYKILTLTPNVTITKI